MARKELSVKPREVTGKKVAQLRKAGILPANVYGRGLDSVSVEVDYEALEKTIRASTANEVLDLKIEGERAARPVVIQRIQRNPLTSTYLHADFYQVSLREKMKADVPLVITGSSNAIDTYNGVLMVTTDTVQVEALPLDLPTHIEVDISRLDELESTIHVRELHVSDNVTILTDGDVAVLKIASPRVGGDEGPAATIAETPAEEAAEEAEAESEAESEEKSE